MSAPVNLHPTTTRGLYAPWQDVNVVTPSDSTLLATVSSALYIGGAGDVKVTTFGGETVTFKAVPVGTILPIRVTQVFATGTTATNLLDIH